MYTREHIRLNRKQICETTDASEFQEGQEAGVDKPVKVVMVDIEDLLIADGIEVKDNCDNMASYSIFKEWFATQTSPAGREYDSSTFKTCTTPVVSGGRAADNAENSPQTDESGCCLERQKTQK